MKLIPLPQVPQPAMVHEQKDYFTLPQLIDYANAVAEVKNAALRASKSDLATAGIVSDHMVLMSREPTREMILASLEVTANLTYTQREININCYKAMIPTSDHAPLANGVDCPCTLCWSLRRIAELEDQLPDEMKHCKIVFKECAKGHGWLTATNWVEHGCMQCELETAKRMYNNVVVKDEGMDLYTLLDAQAKLIEKLTARVQGQE